MASVKRSLNAKAAKKMKMENTTDESNECLYNTAFTSSAWIPKDGTSMRELLKRNREELKADYEMREKAKNPARRILPRRTLSDGSQKTSSSSLPTSIEREHAPSPAPSESTPSHAAPIVQVQEERAAVLAAKEAAAEEAAAEEESTEAISDNNARPAERGGSPDN
ncbi:hypothetical protein EG329_006918 [Mollisiaceae sp. DMI_Dod_QoI]|nr:hypothetical protein EG329_006918 [Helotiales sp. DMI_Dod_QoI]